MADAGPVDVVAWPMAPLPATLFPPAPAPCGPGVGFVRVRRRQGSSGDHTVIDLGDAGR
mgnify:CR=1 FL=1